MVHGSSFCDVKIPPGESRGAEVTGVAAERGKVDRDPLGHHRKGTPPDFLANPIEKSPAQLRLVAAEGHRTAEYDAVGVDRV